MSTRGQIAGSAAMLIGVGVVPAAAVVAGPAGPAAAAGAAGSDILGGAVLAAARFPGFLARSLWRIPVGGALSSRFFARDLSSPAPGRSLQAMWAMLAPLPAPETTRPQGELVGGRGRARRVAKIAKMAKGTHELLKRLHAE